MANAFMPINIINDNTQARIKDVSKDVFDVFFPVLRVLDLVLSILLGVEGIELRGLARALRLFIFILVTDSTRTGKCYRLVLVATSLVMHNTCTTHKQS